VGVPFRYARSGSHGIGDVSFDSFRKIPILNAKVFFRYKDPQFRTLHGTKVNNNINYGRSLSLEDFANFTKTLEDVVFPKCQVKLSPSHFLVPTF
jgi:hypothetical protein